MHENEEYSKGNRKNANKALREIKTSDIVGCQNGIKVEKCAYLAMGQRCTLPGTVAPIVGGEWFCRHHYYKA